ncbi:helix-turn-helix transcriptional regulator [Paenibacillus sp. SYP-B4298]|uniref:helix-turn-helix transcriptional regulator n=1 Tax=Paenibacillus sp. SYP-B4298 TaxID=2996034 RepID=UPI0022DD6F4C|nr:WYL domain-containing protein [Paenibacillus sp. SYP-B4298]
MKRSDRLMAIVLALSQRQETAASLADKLEVSRRTILRDMQALSELGVPIYAINGLHGGYRLMEGYTLPPLQLEPNEALTLLLAMQSMTAYADTPFNRERWTVMDKVKGLLPTEMLDKAGTLLHHMAVDVPRRSYTAPHVYALVEYAAAGQWITAHYRSRNHERRLLLLPKHIYAAHGFWYCDAYSQTHQEVRRFRIDRMSELEKAEAPEEARPDALAAAGASSTAAQPDNGFRLQVELTYRGMLEVERDEHIGEQITAISDERWLLDTLLPESEREWAIRLFYSLGTDARVMQPPELAEAITAMARATIASYTTNIE